MNGIPPVSLLQGEVFISLSVTWSLEIHSLRLSGFVPRMYWSASDMKDVSIFRTTFAVVPTFNWLKLEACSVTAHENLTLFFPRPSCTWELGRNSFMFRTPYLFIAEDDDQRHSTKLVCVRNSDKECVQKRVACSNQLPSSKPLKLFNWHPQWTLEWLKLKLHNIKLSFCRRFSCLLQIFL